MFNTEKDERDRLLRMIRQVAAAVAAVGAGGKDAEAALAQVRKTYRSLDLDPQILTLVDTASLIRMIPGRLRLEALGQLMQEEAKIWSKSGHDERALGLTRRGEALIAAANSQTPR